MRHRLTFRLRRPRTNLPATGAIVRVADHVTTLACVLHEAIGGGSLLEAAKQATRANLNISGCVIAVMFEDMHQVAYPRPVSDSSSKTRRRALWALS